MCAMGGAIAFCLIRTSCLGQIIHNFFPIPQERLHARRWGAWLNKLGVALHDACVVH